MSVGVRSMGPEQDGQLSGVPVLSFAIRFSACAGLYVDGLGLRMYTPPQQQYKFGWRRLGRPD